ncbi:peptidylprolyl isomerase [Endozoicomonas montiporae]|uniref:Peptidyl-prolyl cis-trans isomerase n=2 Tax=Endozoicomonas montiporae TaxID=1027273 RepID=A0A081N8C3_9GAMM|nr:peptidylprolyl isomerase [Endozoicomonas montiporae]AMO55414.1 FKBP-type peptidyl-prolyl cis-trans isomerase [Endozoicomonas montiporae CL-33]KEQ14696.1 peptidylprolyl isomerase [Endozoicomonas montiporae]
MVISDKKVVKIHYTLKNQGGEVMDSSEGHEPLAYLQGAGNILEGLENELTGKQAGDKLKVSIEAAEGYGEYDESLVQPVPMEQFGEHQVEVGMQFHADTAIGPRIVTIIAINEEEKQVVIDANHALAGEDLFFDVEVVEVRDASQEELDHGHVHGPDGHEH